MSRRRTKEEIQAICEGVLAAMHEGVSMRQGCIEMGIGTSTFMFWVKEDEALAEKYACAREALIEKMADDLLVIADEPVGSTDTGATDSGAVQKQRLQVDTRKWLLSKLAPRKYGDKIQTEVTGADGGPVETHHVVEFVRPEPRET